MSDSNTLHREAWIAKATEALQRHGSWTGRIHIHKLLYFVKQLNLADVPFEFEFYHYGPYSFDLDSAIEDMHLYGLLDRVFAKPGYGPKYSLTGAGQNVVSRASPETSAAVDRVARVFGAKSSKDLELMATCLWVKRHDAACPASKVVIERVKTIKPKYDSSEIEAALKEANRAEAELTPHR